MNNYFSLIGLVSLSAIFAIIADTLGKQWANNNKWWLFAVAVILILISGVFFIISLKFGKLGIVSVSWDALTSIILIAIGYFIFRESLTLLQIVAVGLILIGEFILFYK